MDSLVGKVAYISGGARGIGAEIALCYARHGCQVAVGDVESGLARQLVQEIVEAGGSAIAVHHDVCLESDWVAALDKTLSSYGGLDILVNNAAVERTCLLSDIESDEIQLQLNVNVTGTLLGHKYAIRYMRPGGQAGRGGSIINLSSVAGLIGTPGMSVYSATKGAVRMLSKAAAVECGRLGHNIRVNAIFPGLVKTEMGEQLVNDFVGLGVFPDRQTADEQILLSYPIGRTGVPSDISGAALFLASEQSSWMTGAEIVLDGGLTVS